MVLLTALRWCGVVIAGEQLDDPELPGDASPRPTDAEPFVTLNIREAATAAGPYTLIDSQAWSDPTPTTPEATAVETSLATLADGYYQFQWVDGDGDFTALVRACLPGVCGRRDGLDSLVSEGVRAASTSSTTGPRLRPCQALGQRQLPGDLRPGQLAVLARDRDQCFATHDQRLALRGLRWHRRWRRIPADDGCPLGGPRGGALSSSSTGSPWGWMLDAQGRVQGVPLGTEQLTVDYRVPPQLVAGLIPADARTLPLRDRGLRCRARYGTTSHRVAGRTVGR